MLEQEVREDAGVVHEHVETAEGLDGGRDEALDVGGLGDVAVAVETAGSRRRDAPAPLEPVDAAVGEHDGGAGLREPVGAREAESLRGAGDEGDLAVETGELRSDGGLPSGRYRL